MIFKHGGTSTASGHNQTRTCCLAMFLAHPEQFSGLNCLILVPTEALQELHKSLKEDVGSYEDHMSWCSQEFHQLADETYAKLSHPAITLDNAWKIFQSMSNNIECHM